MADAALQNGDSSSTNSMAERAGMPRKKVAVREQEVEGQDADEEASSRSGGATGTATALRSRGSGTDVHNPVWFVF